MNSHVEPAKNRFLFIELLDPAINGLLYGLRAEFGGKEKDSSIHITIRGPYSDPITNSEIEKYRQILEDDALLIQGAGIFENPGASVVFMKISSQNLKRVWWKPDYPIAKYGFNPHITIYTGNNNVYAREIYKFLKNEDIALLTTDFRIVPVASKQLDMFPSKPLPIERCFLDLTNRRLVKDGILQRAENVVRRFRSVESI